MELNNIFKSYDINRTCPPKRITVTHVNDVNTRIIELELTQGDEKLVPEDDCTAFASFVDRASKQLIKDSTQCTINESGNILIPVDNLRFHGKKDVNIEVSVKNQSQEQVLALPFPLWVRVNPSILDDAEVTEDSLGTIPELLDELRQAMDIEKLFDGKAYENHTESAALNRILVFFGSATGSNTCLNLPPLTSADYGKVFHFEINFEQAVLSYENGVRFQEAKTVDGQSVISAYSPYPQHAPVLQGETICFDYKMTEKNVTSFRMILHERYGKQKVNVKITKAVKVSEYTYPKAVIDSSLEIKQNKPVKDSPINVTWTKKKQINSSGNIISNNNLNYAVTNAIPVIAGSMYHIKTRMNYSNAFFVFKDADDETVYVESTDNNTSATRVFDDVVTVPQNAVHLYVGTYNTSSSPESTVALSEYVDNFSLNDLSEPKFADLECRRIEGWRLDNSGLPAEDSSANILTANVSGGETIKIYGRPYLNNYYCSFFSESIEFNSSEPNGGFTQNAFISGLAGTSATENTRFNNISVTVPGNAKTVVVSGYLCFPLIYKMSGYQPKRKWTEKKWCAVGDSLTERNNTAIKNYTDYIAETTGIEVINMGLSGTGFKRRDDEYENEDNPGKAFYQRIKEVSADSDVVTICSSFNDADYIYDEITIPWGSAAYRIINANGDIVSGGINSSFIVSEAIPVTAGKYYYIKTRMKGPNAFFAFKGADNQTVYIEKAVDANGNYPADYNDPLDYEGYIKAPWNAEYLYISSSAGNNPKYTYLAKCKIGTINSSDTNTLCGCINKTIDNLYSVMPAVNLGIIASVPWENFNSYTKPSANIYAEFLEAICKKRGIPFLNLYYESNLRPWVKEFRDSMYKRDGAHPDEDGHRLFAPRIEAFLNKLLLH